MFSFNVDVQLVHRLNGNTLRMEDSDYVSKVSGE